VLSVLRGTLCPLFEVMDSFHFTLVCYVRRYFGGGFEEVGRFNGIEVDSELAYGETIVVPDGEIQEVKKDTPQKKKEGLLPILARGKTRLLQKFTNDAGAGYFIRPVSGGVRTQGLHGKNGVDIGGSIGQIVYASAGGTVLLARTGGWNGGYGNYIIVSHSNGSQTLYGHLNAVYVTTGQTVAQGEAIGELGNTGNSTGPHLHFEVRGAKNPLGDNPRYGL
jgi:murein DD-endopeptidase MepM/ murein hydrolase activator NlpD